MNASLNRRSFLGVAASAATAASVPATGPLPTIRLGKHEVTRLIAGYNPIGGHSHSVPKLSAIMKDWFTPARTVEFIERCERAGINTWQASVDPKAFNALRTAWDRGSKMKWICLMKDEPAEKWKEIIALKPIAIVHHGESTDKLFRTDQQDDLRDFVKKVHDAGILAGISSHGPENIARCEESNYGQDLYMTCFHNIRRDQEKVKAGLGDVPLDELYLQGDPARMTKVVKQVKRPCLAFKILGAGRLASNRAQLEKAFAFAFANIKPTDGVIVGMFPILTDEISEDAAIARPLAARTAT
jgi:hypothetical protein